MTDLDLVIVGAGISGINAGYRFQTEGPKDGSYAILEARQSIGGTWDLFRYPGIRSDSDIFSFGFEWNPWPKKETLGMGGEIREYLKDSAAKHGIDNHILYQRKVSTANWNTKKKVWELKVRNEGEGSEETYTCRFLYLGTGYYDYDTPRQTTIPGIEDFKGKLIHPQFWPEDYDYTDKNMVVIGSGATAVTIVPSVAKQVKHVTMLQRSPTYIFPLRQHNLLTTFILTFLPHRLAHWVNRLTWIFIIHMMIKFCGAFPRAAKRIVRFVNKRLLPSSVSVDPHFNPSYFPWEQRLCASMNGDIFAALRSGKASIVTDTIQTVTEDAIKLTSGQELHPDIIVTATGLKVIFAGGIQLSRDGKPMTYADRVLWQSTMVQDIPNIFVTMGYENASWTLGADCAACLMARVINKVYENGAKTATPHLEPKAAANMPRHSLFSLKSTYLQNADDKLPSGGTGDWAPRSNYFSDMYKTLYTNLDKDLIIE